jgi:hypothetical protein
LLILQGLPVANFGETLEEWEEISASGIASPLDAIRT